MELPRKTTLAEPEEKKGLNRPIPIPDPPSPPPPKEGE